MWPAVVLVQRRSIGVRCPHTDSMKAESAKADMILGIRLTEVSLWTKHRAAAGPVAPCCRATQIPPPRLGDAYTALLDQGQTRRLPE